MPRKTLLLILVLAAVTAILIFLAIMSQSMRQPTSTQGPNPTLIPVEKTAKVLFNPTSVDLSSTTATPTSSVNILVDSGGAEISGVQVELQYDPNALRNVVLTPTVDATGFFGSSASVLFNDVKQDTGRISYAVAISQGQGGKAGVGKIATLTFTKGLGAIRTTQITFLDKTLVTILGANDSALKETVPLSITFTNDTIQAPATQPTFVVTPTIAQ